MPHYHYAHNFPARFLVECSARLPAAILVIYHINLALRFRMLGVPLVGHKVAINYTVSLAHITRHFSQKN